MKFSSITLSFIQTLQTEMSSFLKILVSVDECSMVLTEYSLFTSPLVIPELFKESLNTLDKPTSPDIIHKNTNNTCCLNKYLFSFHIISRSCNDTLFLAHLSFLQILNSFFSALLLILFQSHNSSTPAQRGECQTRRWPGGSSSGRCSWRAWELSVPSPLPSCC